MPQLLALEWNDSEARLVVAASRGGQVMIEQAFSVPLDSSSGEEDQPQLDVGERIAAALAARRIGKSDTLVAVGRSSIELRLLSLPPAPADELPELVRFQAMREFNEFSEDWLLDFLPIERPEPGPQNVLAAAIGPELVAQIQETCQTAGLKPQRLILRPCAAASLLGRLQTDELPQLRLLIDLLGDEADLTVIDERQVIFLRTARMGGDPLEDPDHAQELLAEIRRTIAAAQNQLSGRRVDSIVLCGLGPQQSALAGLIEERLEISSELFDPFADLSLGRQLQQTPPENPGRFAPLLGLVLAELEGTAHAIDFLHPRRRAEARRENTKLLLAGALAVMAIALFFAFGQWRTSMLKADIRALTKQSQTLEQEIAKAKAAQKAVEEIEKWTATDVVWLDELRRLSEDFPSAHEAMVNRITFGPSSTGGMITLNGLALDSEAVTTVEQDLRDAEQRRKKKHKLEDDRLRTGSVTGSGHDAATEHYTWKFDSILYVAPEEQ